MLSRFNTGVDVSEETKQMAIFMAGAFLIISTIAWSISWHYTSVACTAMENGYTTELQGATGPQWVKKGP